MQVRQQKQQRAENLREIWLHMTTLQMALAFSSMLERDSFGGASYLPAFFQADVTPSLYEYSTMTRENSMK